MRNRAAVIVRGGPYEFGSAPGSYGGGRRYCRLSCRIRSPVHPFAPLEYPHFPGKPWTLKMEEQGYRYPSVGICAVPIVSQPLHPSNTRSAIHAGGSKLACASARRNDNVITN